MNGNIIKKARARQERIEAKLNERIEFLANDTKRKLFFLFLIIANIITFLLAIGIPHGIDRLDLAFLLIGGLSLSILCLWLLPIWDERK